MRPIFMTLLLVFVALATSDAQEPQFPPPVEEHAWLKQFEGEWSTTSSAVAEAGAETMQCQGKMTARMLGGFWIVFEIENQMGATNMQALQTIGYDTSKKKYVGSWVDSVLGHLWTYEGIVDKEGQRLSLTAKGPNFMTGGDELLYRDRYEFKSDDEIATISETKSEGGDWVPFMTGKMRRVQPE